MSEDEKRLTVVGEDDEKGDREIADGMRFSLRRDPADLRWDLLEIRIPNLKMYDPAGDEGTAVGEFSGPTARWRFARFVFSVVAGLGSMFGAPQAWMMITKLLADEVRTQEVLDSGKPVEPEPKSSIEA